MESPTVTIIDDSIRDQLSNLDFYSFVDYVVQYGMNLNQVLERIIVTRSFIAHQLADTIICKLPKTIQKYRSNIVIITNLLTTDEQLHLSKKQWLLKHMIKSIHTISESIITLFSPVRIDDYRKVIGKDIQKLKITNNKAVIK
jgi:hypothetical protein